MGDFFTTAMAFPAVIFTFPLAVVLLYWTFGVLFGVGGSVAEGGDAGGDGGDGVGGFTGVMALLGLSGVPAAIPLSLLIAVAWFTAMAGTELLDATAARIATVPVALVAGWGVARLLVLPLRRVFPTETGAMREDFVGKVCVVRTSRVTADFGQAEVTAEDGGTAIVQVRAEGPEGADLGAGSRALIFGYEPEREIFWVAPYDAGPATGHFENQLPR
ncbi:hypothetical protein [Streptomyces ginkgonis]|uniref:hypothetical protein n=1 Tax=Streptomyces ginkgonis TaxID=1812259 RepID=UPI002176E37A|nr:hypothetical protein [Streptomyces ginkgonis]